MLACPYGDCRDNLRNSRSVFLIVGPPLEESFSEFCGFQGEDVKNAIEYGFGAGRNWRNASHLP